MGGQAAVVIQVREDCVRSSAYFNGTLEMIGQHGNDLNMVCLNKEATSEEECPHAADPRVTPRLAEAVGKRLFAQWLEGGQPEAFPILHTSAIPEDFVRRIANFQ